VKGGVIGAAAGAILGGVIGNNVDVQKKRVP
jgi:outer membrane lipoprotein SlyB